MGIGPETGWPLHWPAGLHSHYLGICFDYSIDGDRTRERLAPAGLHSHYLGICFDHSIDGNRAREWLAPAGLHTLSRVHQD